MSSNDAAMLDNFATASRVVCWFGGGRLCLEELTCLTSQGEALQQPERAAAARRPCVLAALRCRPSGMQPAG